MPIGFLFSFFFLANCKNINCIINIGDHYVDLSELKIANNNYHYVDSNPDNGNFSFRLCGDLIENDPLVPSCGYTVKGWAGAAYRLDAQGNLDCYQTAATDSFEVKVINDKEFHIQYGSDTDEEPGSVDEVHTIYEFHYEENQKTEDPVSVTVRDEAKNRFVTLTFQLNYKFLPNKPTPTPIPIFNPEYIQESKTKPGMGIRFNLSEFSRFDETYILDGENIDVQFSPGNYIDCPFPYNCRHYTPSSLYLCRAGNELRSKPKIKGIHEEKGFCSSFGVVSASITYDQSGLSEGEGVNVNYKSNDPSKSAKVFFSCDESLAPHELRLKTKITGDDKSVNIQMRTSDTCIRVATPVPDPIRGYCKTQVKVHGTDLLVDLRDLSQDSGYKVTNAKITDQDTGLVIEEGNTFIVHPCGALGCPSGFTCPKTKTNDDAISSFWNCHPSTGSCESIGSITTSDIAFEADDSVDGVVVRYGSSLFGNKNATIQYVCQEGANTPILESNATFDSTNKIYKIRMRHKSFCTPFSKKKKSLSGGAIFLILLAVIAFLYFVVGTIIVSIIKKEFTFINKEFWVEFGLCIKEACMRICSCSKASDNLMKSTYDKI